MGLSFNLGRLSPSLFTDSSLNVGIGAAPSGSYKLEVTGTAKVSSTLLVSGAATFSSTVTATQGKFSGSRPQGIFTENGTSGLYLRDATGTGYKSWSIGTNDIVVGFAITPSTALGGTTFTTPSFIINESGDVGIGISADNPIGNGGTYRNLLVGNGAGYGVFQGISTATATGSTIVALSGGTTGASGSKNGGSINLQLDGTSTTNAIGRWVFYTNDGTTFGERMRITSNGTVGIGITTGTYNGRLCIEGAGSSTSNVHLELLTDTNRSYIQSANRTFIANAPLTIECSSIIITPLAGSGSRTVNAAADGTLSASSDSSLKQEDKEYKIQGLAEILQLQPRAYKWLSDIEIRGEEATTEIGFFADEVNPIIPSAAPKGNDDLYGFYDRAVIAALVKAIQEQQAIITSLQDRLDKAGL